MSGRDPPKLAEEERILWDELTRSVLPLPGRRADPRSKSEQGGPRPSSRASSAATPAQRAQNPPSLQAFDRRIRQRLRRGRLSIDTRIDLHGRTQDAAYSALLRFVRDAQADGARFVLVITGKGSRPDAGSDGVLRRQVPLWLGSPEFRPYVLGFDAAQPAHGGEGALYVRLRRARP